MHVTVVGGGITGLAAAHELVGAGATVTVLEADDRLGGKILTTDLAGRPVDCGPDMFLARVPWGLELVRELGLAAELIQPTTGAAWVWARGRARRLPEGMVLGVPTSVTAVARSGILGPGAVLRAGLDLVRPRLPLPGRAGTRAPRPDRRLVAGPRRHRRRRHRAPPLRTHGQRAPGRPAARRDQRRPDRPAVAGGQRAPARRRVHQQPLAAPGPAGAAPGAPARPDRAGVPLVRRRHAAPGRCARRAPPDGGRRAADGHRGRRRPRRPGGAGGPGPRRGPVGARGARPVVRPHRPRLRRGGGARPARRRVRPSRGGQRTARPTTRGPPGDGRHHGLDEVAGRSPSPGARRCGSRRAASATTGPSRWATTSCSPPSSGSCTTCWA